MTGMKQIWLDPLCQSDADYHIDRCWHSERPENCDECGTAPDEYLSRPETDRLIAEAWDAASRIVAEYPDHRENAGFDWRAEIQSAFGRAKTGGKS